MAFGGIIGRQTTTYTNEEIDGMIQQVAGGLKIERGSYVGNGLYGSENPTTIIFRYNPILLWIWKETAKADDGLSYSGLFNISILNSNYIFNANLWFQAGFNTMNDTAVCKAKFENNTLSFYNEQPGNGLEYQFNRNGYDYSWWAICTE